MSCVGDQSTELRHKCSATCLGIVKHNLCGRRASRSSSSPSSSQRSEATAAFQPCFSPKAEASAVGAAAEVVPPAAEGKLSASGSLQCSAVVCLLCVHLRQSCSAEFSALLCLPVQWGLLTPNVLYAGTSLASVNQVHCAIHRCKQFGHWARDCPNT